MTRAAIAGYVRWLPLQAVQLLTLVSCIRIPTTGLRGKQEYGYVPPTPGFAFSAGPDLFARLYERMVVPANQETLL
eukprot:scaffold14910_cov19-Tisochrysis_lutea.AAC.1